jgi:HEAT repeat protein
VGLGQGKLEEIMKYTFIILVFVLITACAASPQSNTSPAPSNGVEIAATQMEPPLPQPTPTAAATPTSEFTPTPAPVSPYIIPEIVVVDQPGGDEIRTWIASLIEGSSLLMLNARPGAGFNAMLSINPSGDSAGISYDPIWAYAGAEHLYDGKILNYQRTFDSDPQYPLTFKLVKGLGYVYLSGRGTITTEDGKAVSLGAQDTIETWLPKLTSAVQIQREGAAQALGWLAKTPEEKEKAVTALIPALKDPAMPVRRDAAEALGKLGDARATAPLYELLTDPDAWVGKVATEALQTGLAVGLDTEQVSALIENLNSADPDTRLNAMRILGASKNNLAYEPLLALIGEADVEVKAEAAKSLGALGDPRALQTLLGLLADETSGVRSGAALGLGSLGSKDAVEPLIQALADPEWEVRIAVATALGMLGDGRAIQPLEDALAKAEYTNEKDAITAALEKLKGQ